MGTLFILVYNFLKREIFILFLFYFEIKIFPNKKFPPFKNLNKVE
jgi:hypothetical protein